MKKIAVALSVIASTPAVFGSEWTYFLDQRNILGDGSIRTEVAAEGEMLSKLPIPLGGSEFTLWAREKRSGFVPITHHVGTDTVGAYLPGTTLSISSPDPYDGGVTRTRVDQGFSLTIEVDGLKPVAENTPLAANAVLFDHRVELREVIDGSLEAPSAAEPVVLVDQSRISENTEESPIVKAYPELNSPVSFPLEDVYTKTSLETFKIYALPDGEIAELELASDQIRVWPLASSEFSGFDPSLEYRLFPKLIFNLKNLYPKSETYLQYYQGPKQAAGVVGVRILDVQLLLDQDTPSDGLLEVIGIERFFNQAGVWTVEVLTETVFGIERLDCVELNVGGDLQIRGRINTLE